MLSLNTVEWVEMKETYTEQELPNGRFAVLAETVNGPILADICLKKETDDNLLFVAIITSRGCIPATLMGVKRIALIAYEEQEGGEG